MHWVFLARDGLFLVVVSGGYSPGRCMGFLLWGLLWLWSTGSGRAGLSNCGSWAQQLWLPGFSCSSACGVLLDLGWQADPYPLHHQGSQSFAWVCIFLSRLQRLLPTLSWCSVRSSVSEDGFLVHPCREMDSTSSYPSASLSPLIPLF